MLFLVMFQEWCVPSSFKQATIIIIITKHIMARFERYARKIETQIM